MRAKQMARKYSWPDGHWNWPVNLTHKHGVRAGSLIYTGGQVALDADGVVQHPGDSLRQCDGAMAYLARVLEDLGADLSDLVKLVVYFVGDVATEDRLLNQIASLFGPDVGPVINTIGLSELCYPGLMVEIEGVAMRGEDGKRLSRQCFHLDNMPKLPTAFAHAIRCGELIFTSDMSAMTATGTVDGDLSAQTTVMMDRLCDVLSAAGADIGDVLKLNVFYKGDGTAEDWERPAGIRAGYFYDPGPAATGMPVTQFPHPDMLTKIAVTAMRGADGGRLEKTFAWPQGHWDWTAPLPYKHGNRCGNIIHVGGQVSLDQSAKVIDPDDMVAQTKRAMDNLKRVLAEFGATLDDVVKVTTFYQGAASADALHENLLIRSNSYTEPGPATTGIPMRALVYEHMVIEIEAIAIVDG